MSVQVWQIAAGDPGRYSSELFKRHDLMCLGPGDPGHIFDRAVEYEGLEISSQKLGALRRFANPQEVQAGHIILLRETYKVVSLGVVADDQYRWNPCLDDVYGWDLQHSRRVVWQHHLDSEIANIQKSEDFFNNRKQIPMFTKVDDPTALDKISHLFPKIKSRKLREDLSGVSEPMAISAVKDDLHNEGLSHDRISSLIDVIEDHKRLVRWYERNGEESERPSENEIVAMMTIPLMSALGWSKQLLGVEWNNVDLAGFNGVPSRRGSCVFVCEGKSLGSSMNKAYRQAIDYVNGLDLTSVNKIITTDGPRVLIYERENGSWSQSPAGYVNILKVRRNNLLPANTDGIKTLMALTPERIASPLRTTSVVN